MKTKARTPLLLLLLQTLKEAEAEAEAIYRGARRDYILRIPPYHASPLLRRQLVLGFWDDRHGSICLVASVHAQHNRGCARRIVAALLGAATAATGVGVLSMDWGRQ